MQIPTERSPTTPPEAFVGGALGDSEIATYGREGFVILPGIVPPEHLDILRTACGALSEAGRSYVHNGPGSREHAFLFEASRTRTELGAFIHSRLMADLCHDVIGDNVWHINDQFSCKAARTGGAFGWHQDSAYIGGPHQPYLTCWIAMDDMTSENGTLHVIPASRAKVREAVQDAYDLPDTDQRFIGGDRGEAIICPAGTIALFASTIFHASAPNRSPRPRRAYVVQYGIEATVGVPGIPVYLEGTPVLSHGRRVGP